MSGRVVHFELPYDDGERANEFYRQVFGWDLTPVPEMDYTMVTSGPSGEEGPTEPGYINGGMMKREAPFTAPNIVIDVENLEAALEKINQAGGTTIAERQAVGEMGFAASFQDSEGNIVGLWENPTPA